MAALLIAALSLSLFVGLGRPTMAQVAACWPDGLPLGALPPARPIWCLPPGPNGPATFKQGPNSWLDDFDHGLSNAPLGAGYRVFDTQEQIFRTQHFRHADHWMMDLAPVNPSGAGLLGGGMIRPDRSFRFEGGRLVVEFDAAASVQDYCPGGADVWPEVVVTTAPAPTGVIPDGLYAYGQFGGHWSFGCRMQPTRVPVCALYAPTPRTGDPANFATSAGRVFEMSHFQHIGATFGGNPFDGRERLWRVCQGTDPDLYCRDRFRLELTRDSVTLYVNGGLYFRQTGLRVPLPDEIVGGDVYTYFAGWEVRQTQHIRFHWDRLAVNLAAGPSAAPGFDGPAPPAPTAAPPTATRPPAATATRTPTATAIVQASASPSRTPTRTATPGSGSPPQSGTGFVTRATLSTSHPDRGRSVAVNVSVTSSSARTILVDVEIWDPQGTRVAQRFFDNQVFAAGQTRSYDLTWLVPSDAGDGVYHVTIGLFSPGWGTVYVWSDGAASFVVDSDIPAAPVWWQRRSG